ncbi:MAG: hypothetical protein ACREWG_00585 [Gammaproteobacteria bacterium]
MSSSRPRRVQARRSRPFSPSSIDWCGLLREVRRRAPSLELVSLSGADPLNLAGIVTPGGTVPRGSGRVLYLDGVPIASQSGREVHMSEDLDQGAAWEARKALLRRGVGATRLSWPKSERAAHEHGGPTYRLDRCIC